MARVAADDDALVETAALVSHHRVGEALDVAPHLHALAVPEEGKGLVGVLGREGDGIVGLDGGHAGAGAVGPAGRLVETHGLLVGGPGDPDQRDDPDGDNECRRAPEGRGTSIHGP